MKRSSKPFDYEKLVQLNHNEIPAKINIETGELTELKPKKSNIPTYKELWQPKTAFTKNYNKVIDWIEAEGIMTDLELRILWRMMRMAKYETNSLEPIGDDHTFIQLAEEFNVNRNKIKPILKKFYDLGVYGRFDVKRIDVPYTKFWVLNPYLCFSGRVVDSDIAQLFKGTVIQLKFKQLYPQH